MQSKMEIWYCEGSPAASLAQQLAGQYALRELPKPDSQHPSKVHAEVTSQGESEPNPGLETDGLAVLGASHAARAVCLADLDRDDSGEVACHHRGGCRLALPGRRNAGGRPTASVQADTER